MSFSIAIDGPSGVGKSTIASVIADKFNFIHLDTGAMYRAVALFFVENNLEPEKYLNENLCEKIDIKVEFEDKIQKTFLNGIDVTENLRTQKVSEMASKIAEYHQIRNKLVALQREISMENNIVVDGRDIGTNVLPNADLKIYLDASVKVRADRRFKEMLLKNPDVDYKEIEEGIVLRDLRDTTRKYSPLKKAEDAVEIDTSGLSIDELSNMIFELVFRNLEVSCK